MLVLLYKYSTICNKIKLTKEHNLYQCETLLSKKHFTTTKSPLEYTCSTCYAILCKEVEHERQRPAKAFEKNGWSVVRINGSHHVLQKDGKTTVVPLHGKDVPIGLLNSILKETGLK